MAKLSGKKLSHVTLTVKPSGITSKDVTTSEQHLDVSIYRISYCSADATYDRVVAFIATNKNETLECHAFLTSKKKIAQAAALTISQAFTIAFEKWQNLKDAQSEKKLTQNGDKASNGHQKNGADKTRIDEPSLIDLSDENICPTKPPKAANESFEFDLDLDDSFAKLAESRTTTVNGSSGNGHADPFVSMLPNNVTNVNFQDLPSYFNFSEEANNEEKNGKFFTDDSPDDLFSL